MKSLTGALNLPSSLELRPDVLKRISLDSFTAFLICLGVVGFSAGTRLLLHGNMILWIATVVLIHIAVLIQRGLYSINVRYLGQYDVTLIYVCALPAGLVLMAGPLAPGIGLRPFITLLAILSYVFLSSSAITIMRLASRSLLERKHRTSTPTSERRVLVVGAGDAGETIVREILRRQRGRVKAVGLVDDDDTKQSLRIHGVPVLGHAENIPELVRSHNVQEIILAIPVASGSQIRRLHSLCRQANVPVRTLPAISSLLEGAPTLSGQLREVSIEDLLRRDTVTMDLGSVSEYIGGGRVLITGAGGSIGSELARQIARLNPERLVLLGKGENSLYEVQQELLHTTSAVPVAIVADVRDQCAMSRVFADHNPTVVFHAAAHKHVPLMQSNLREAIRNNVLGTFVVAELAVRYRASKFVLISSDKAVRPRSVMGATKRICELIVASQADNAVTEFATVRFGNVLGSRGSLIPLLTSQIKRGGPVTVTHPDMTRYFMTIPEAVQLVLEAGAIAKRGEICILDMGDPVRIDDLARELIRLHGLTPDEDVLIKYTGIRPGEKLNEELVYDPCSLKPTSNPKVRIVHQADEVSVPVLHQAIEKLVEMSDTADTDRVREFLMELCSNPDLLRSSAYVL